MKSLWTIISVLAVAHLLALGVFGLWLWQTQRLDADRIDQMRDVFAAPIPHAQAITDEAAEQAEAEQQAAIEQAQLEAHPVTSSEQIDILDRIDQSNQLAQTNLKEQQELLFAKIQAREAALDRREAALEAERDAWETSTQKQREQRNDEQFKRAVKTIAKLPAKAGKGKIIALVDSGKTDQAVAYLDSMASLARVKILREFKTPEENILATVLLEQIRTLGTSVEPDGLLSDADTNSTEHLDQP